jgi:Ser/Thr protein kinase RdoA (MazF antagonist)
LISASMTGRCKALNRIEQAGTGRFAFCRAAALWSGARPEKKVAAAYLQGYNSVKPLSEKEKETLEFMAQVAAIRFALARAVIIANAPEGVEVATRPPAALLEHYKYWHKAERRGGKADKLLRSHRPVARCARNWVNSGV